MHGTGRVKILTIPLIEISHQVKIFSYYINFSDGGRCHIETSPLICSGFYMITAPVMKELTLMNVGSNTISDL